MNLIAVARPPLLLIPRVMPPTKLPKFGEHGVEMCAQRGHRRSLHMCSKFSSSPHTQTSFSSYTPLDVHCFNVVPNSWPPGAQCLTTNHT